MGSFLTKRKEMTDGFIDRLREALGQRSVLTGADIEPRYCHDLAGNSVAQPRAVVRPSTTEEVSAVLRLCHREKVPVTTQGGMTGVVGGALPNANEIVLSMELMNAVEEVDTSSGAAVVQAGAPLQRYRNGSSRKATCSHSISARAVAALSAATSRQMPAATA